MQRSSCLYFFFLKGILSADLWSKFPVTFIYDSTLKLIFSLLVGREFVKKKLGEKFTLTSTTSGNPLIVSLVSLTLLPITFSLRSFSSNLGINFASKLPVKFKPLVELV